MAFQCCKKKYSKIRDHSVMLFTDPTQLCKPRISGSLCTNEDEKNDHLSRKWFICSNSVRRALPYQFHIQHAGLLNQNKMCVIVHFSSDCIAFGLRRDLCKGSYDVSKKKNLRNVKCTDVWFLCKIEKFIKLQIEIYLVRWNGLYNVGVKLLT